MLEIDVAVRAGTFALEAAFRSPDQATVALFGRSGAGKSTLLGAIAGLIRPAQGTIKLDDTLFFSSKESIDLPIESRGVGYVFQEGRLFPHLSVAENLDYGAKRARARGATVVHIRRDELIDLLALEPLLRRRTPALSGGERQRVALARALLAHPRLLLLDEPLAALDAPRKLEIIEYIERLRDVTKVPMVLVSHAIGEVSQLADYLVVLDHGAVRAAGSTATVMTQPELVPLIGAHEASSLIEGVLQPAADPQQLARLRFPGGELFVATRVQRPGRRTRIRVHAKDVALSLTALQDVSITNVLAARVVRIQPGDNADTHVLLDVGGTPLLAAIAHASCVRLNLRPGLQVWALIKSIALMESASFVR